MHPCKSRKNLLEGFVVVPEAMAEKTPKKTFGN